MPNFQIRHFLLHRNVQLLTVFSLLAEGRFTDMRRKTMYVKKTCGYILGESSAEITTLKGLLDTFFPATTQSVIWKYWRAILDPKLCADCLSHHGKIFAMDEVPEIEPPLHDNCRCAILPMDTITPGGATKDEENGADFYLANFGKTSGLRYFRFGAAGAGLEKRKAAQAVCSRENVYKRCL